MIRLGLGLRIGVEVMVRFTGFMKIHLRVRVERVRHTRTRVSADDLY
jgi:hypothetical protein